jgi:membrane protease YdiL (CAAX protease family)
VTTDSFRRQLGSTPSACDPFRYAIALWLVLLLVIGLSVLLPEEEGLSAQAIVLADLVIAAVVLVFAAVLIKEIRPLFETFGTWRAIPCTAGTLALIAAFMAGYKLVATSIGFRYTSMAEGYAGTGWPLWGVLVSAAAVPAIFEEIAFRGVIQTGMERVMAPREALIVQAAMFSVLHLLPAVFVSHFVIGLVLGFLRRRTGSIYPGMLVHAAWNTWVVTQDWHGM